ncbi:hypothetical protein MKX01_024830 [Papaver californicum]|nr:hypothetical protein MKX01_024830 [Papaver californicum]
MTELIIYYRIQMRTMQGKVVGSTNDKTIAVEVIRLAPHPKYKRRVIIKMKFQAHDPENQFKVCDVVQLEKSRPISKIKSFLAIVLPPKNSVSISHLVPKELGIPLEGVVYTKLFVKSLFLLSFCCIFVKLFLNFGHLCTFVCVGISMF